MNRFFILVLMLFAPTASAVVIRHDIDDSCYRVPSSEFAALADLPGEGHGILIAPQWIITAGHTVTDSPEVITLNGASRKVERVIIHPGYKRLPEALIARALESGDAS